MKYFKNRDWTIIILMVVTIAALITASYYALHSYVKDGATLRTVEAVCDYAHGIRDGGSEEACARALEASEAEYTCDDNDNCEARKVKHGDPNQN